MPEAVLVYVSAASDLAAEREILGRAIAEIPGDVAFRVVQSPDGNGVIDAEAIASAHVHVVVLGGDIRAPVGLEWQLARQSGRSPVALLRQDTLRTLAGQNFVRLVREVQSWLPFSGGAMLRRQVLMLVADHILTNAVHHGLGVDKIARLHRWRGMLQDTTAAVDEVTRGGAGDSSVVLSRRQISTSGGIALGDLQLDEGLDG